MLVSTGNGGLAEIAQGLCLSIRKRRRTAILEYIVFIAYPKNYVAEPVIPADRLQAVLRLQVPLSFRISAADEQPCRISGELVRLPIICWCGRYEISEIPFSNPLYGLS